LQRWRDEAVSAALAIVGPADEREARLQRIFEQVLGTSPVGVTDSFFNLGGHSLLVFKLISACAREFQVRLSIADVFSAPSVRELSTKLTSAAPAPDSSLVPLFPKPGKPLVVFIHAASGSALPFIEVAKHLDDFSSCALQTPDPAADSPHLTTIDGLAAQYVAAVDDVRGFSPLILAGWSMGGCIALEMARLWRARGVETAAVLMLDTWMPPAALREPGARAQARKTILEMDVLGREGLGAADFESMSEAIGRLSRVLERNRQAFVDYQPAWLDADVDLLRASEPVSDLAFPGDYFDGDRGWRAYVSRVTVQDIAGSHFSLVAPEHATALADTIRAVADVRLQFSEI
jgi:thioesterase domain-containing protein/acyl carrier protein